MSRSVELRVGGQNYRVVSSAPEGEVQRLAALINRRLAELAPRHSTAHGLLLVAMTLAHELEGEHARRESLERKTRTLLEGVLQRIDRAIGADLEPEGGGEELVRAEEAEFQ